jgi:hypothetical protein
MSTGLTWRIHIGSMTPVRVIASGRQCIEACCAAVHGTIMLFNLPAIAVAIKA